METDVGSLHGIRSGGLGIKTSVTGDAGQWW